MPQRLVNFLNELWSFITTVFLTLTMFLFPIHSFLELVAALITIDFITGICASLKRREKITPKRLSKTVMKLLFYSVAIISTYILQKIMNEGIGLPKICAAYIGATELKSIYDHISTLTGEDVITALWKFMKAKIDEMISGISMNRKNNDNQEPNLG
jgi:phage-related holin